MRWTCGGTRSDASAANGGCPRKTFTEWVRQLPPRCRMTARLREQAAD